MAEELTNSRRRLSKVTYTPVELPADGLGGGALEVGTAIAALGLVPEESSGAAASLGPSDPLREALNLFERLTVDPDPGERLKAAFTLSQEPSDLLGRAVDAVRTHRESELTKAIRDLAALVREYREAQRREPPADTDTPAAPRVAVPSLPIPPGVADRLGNDLSPDAWAAASWADAEKPARAGQFTDLLRSVLPLELRRTAGTALMQGLPAAFDKLPRMPSVKHALTQRKVQPVGLLHLEELVITPLEIERGELVYTLPMAPKEKVTVSHKEWSLKQEEYARFVQDYFENYSERGVAEKSDIAVASKSETEHSNTLSMSQSAAAGGTSLAGSVNMSSSVTTEKQSLEKSRRDTHEITERASALAIRDQRVSFTVTTVSGREDFTARLYENPHEDKVMIVDYFRRMRRWRNQLFRTGIRLTYDVVLPDPGKRLRERWQALTALDAQIAAPFEYTYGVESNSSMWVGVAGAGGLLQPSPYFTPPFDEMSVAQLINVGRAAGLALPPAPVTLTSSEELLPINSKPQPGDPAVALQMVITFPDTHRPAKIHLGGRVAGPPESSVIVDYWAGRRADIPGPAGVYDTFISASFELPAHEPASSGKMPIAVLSYGGAIGEIRAKVDLVPTQESWRQWRSQVWAMLRQAALTKFNEKREALRQQRAALARELEAPDTLSLRRMEREQIMYLVFEWLFPAFGTGGTGPSAGATPAQAMLEYGEYVKLVQEAIDWDRVLVLLYPYFWDRPDQHALKLYLHHPDAFHREFLRAGAARIVLAIKPGREREVVTLLDQGQLGALAPSSRFIPLIDAVQATETEFKKRAAAATAPPLPDNDNDDDDDDDDTVSDQPSFGVLIGQWEEWTPTSALDMDVTMRDVE